MNAATVDDLLARERRDDRTALVDATGREYDRHWLCTSSWKAGNFLRHAGVRTDVTVGVAGEGPLALLACFGTTLLEGTTWFDPPADLSSADGVQAIVAPVDDLDGYDLSRGTQRVGYGDAPGDPGVHHFDAGLWSENPSFPPLSIDPDTPVLTDGDRALTHEDVLDSARAVADEYGLERGDRVVVRAPLSDPRTVVAGVIAPLLAEGTIVFTGDADKRAEQGEYAVVGESDRWGPEPSRIDLEDRNSG